ncbi:hypothetical protein [Phaffia rhodozyma]|uniref:Uncharacterized protein n=1 Tax=Phaffia rhodozyma TaxID=264483 RepID=A0A0F7SW80_PHARH|nr:hypothetical protein [Phaffia rhodozyma]
MRYHQPNLENEHRDYKSLLLNLRHQDTLDLRQGLISPLVRYTRKKPARSRASEQRSRLEDESDMDIGEEDEDGYEDKDDEAAWVIEDGVRKRIKGEDKEEGDGRFSDVFGFSLPPLLQARPVLPRIPPEDERTLFPLYVSQLPPPPFETLADEILLLAKKFLKQDRKRCLKVKPTRLPATMDSCQTVEPSLPTSSLCQPPSAQPQPPISPPSLSSQPPSLFPPTSPHHYQPYCPPKSSSQTSSITSKELIHTTRSLLAVTLDGLSKVTPVDTFGTARAKKRKLREAESGWERVLNVLSGLDQDSLDPVVKERTIARLETIYGLRKRNSLDHYADEIDELANDSDLNPGRSKRRDKTRHKRNAPLLTKKERSIQEETRFKSQETLDKQFVPTSLLRPLSVSSCFSSSRGSKGFGSVGSSNLVRASTETDRRARKRTRGISEESTTSSDDIRDEDSDLNSEDKEVEEEEEEEEEEEMDREQEEGEDEAEKLEGTGLTIFHSPFIPPRKRSVERSKDIKES